MPILKDIKKHKLILDTHVLIWVMTGNSMIKEHFRKNLKIALHDDRALVSTLSFWEIGMLVQKNRISLDMDPMEWTNQVLETEGLQTCDLTPEIAINSTRLCGVVHGDPIDRMLIASAQEENATLVTCDSKILEYGKSNLLSVHNPTK